MSKYTTIIEQLQMADRPDRGIDRNVHVACGLHMDARVYVDQFFSNPYTSSVNAAITLVKRMLPGWEIEISLRKGKWFACVGEDITCATLCYNGLVDGKDDTNPQIPLLIAMFRALEEIDCRTSGGDTAHK